MRRKNKKRLAAIEAKPIELPCCPNYTWITTKQDIDKTAGHRGYTEQIRCDNGPEIRSEALTAWAEKHNVKLLFIQPGKRTQNALFDNLKHDAHDNVTLLLRDLSF
jgi:hypothetical protein